MKLLLIANLATLTMISTAQATVFHYACRGEASRYAVTVNTAKSTVKMQDHGPSGKLTTFQILSDDPSTCGKGGWSLNDGATFCYATQGYATLTWHGHDNECDQADTE
jgi:hypothetical protein